MSSYNDFAMFYDKFMADVDYNSWADFLLGLFCKFGKKPSILLDLACGTGEFSNLMAEKGMEVIGVDISEDMLSVAQEKTAEKGNNILYLCQTAEELDLFGTVDGAICCLDSLNHITNIKNLEKAIKKVALFLEPGGLFIFDVNTPYKHCEVLGNNIFVLEDDEVYCVWQNFTNNKTLTTEISLDFFQYQNGVYKRFSESFKERGYNSQEISKILAKSGLEILAVYDGTTEKKPSEKTERWVYVVRK